MKHGQSDLENEIKGRDEGSKKDMQPAIVSMGWLRLAGSLKL